MINTKTFTNSELDGSYFLVYTHNLNTQGVIPTIYDNTGRCFPVADVFSLGNKVGDNKANVVKLELPGSITGTWTLLLEYQATAETSSGRRAFELSTTTDPDETMRVIIGKADTPSLNVTLTAFIAWLLTKLGFLKVASNLSDLSDTSSARSNLGVYSTTQVDSALSDKATPYQSGSGAVLGVANTAVYTPTSDYHPATKKYADESGGGRIMSGVTVIGDMVGEYYRVTVSLGTTLPDADYKVLGELYDPTGSTTGNYNYSWYVIAKTTTSFKIFIRSTSPSATDNLTFSWELKEL